MLQPLDLLKRQAAEEYPPIYERVITEWQQPGPDALWLLYSANYLFRVGEVRWTVDPLTLPLRLSGTLPIHLEQDFAKLDFLILTHRHSDHLNWELLKKLRSVPVPWIVPAFLIEECLERTGIPKARIIPAIPGQWIELHGIHILPLEGSHWEYSPDTEQSAPPIKGVPSVCYLFEFHGKHWYLPGDVRAFDISKIPHLGAMHGVAAHVWMGRMKDAQSEPPLFSEFCDYYSRFQTDRVVLTHLYEFGREMKDIWTIEHTQRIITAFADLAPMIRVEAACTGSRIDL